MGIGPDSCSYLDPPSETQPRKKRQLTELQKCSSNLNKAIRLAQSQLSKRKGSRHPPGKRERARRQQAHFPPRGGRWEGNMAERPQHRNLFPIREFIRTEIVSTDTAAQRPEEPLVLATTPAWNAHEDTQSLALYATGLPRCSPAQAARQPAPCLSSRGNRRTMVRRPRNGTPARKDAMSSHRTTTW